MARRRTDITPAQAALTLVGNAVFNRPDLAFQSNARTMQLALRFEF